MDGRIKKPGSLEKDAIRKVQCQMWSLGGIGVNAVETIRTWIYGLQSNHQDCQSQPEEVQSIEHVSMVNAGRVPIWNNGLWRRISDASSTWAEETAEKTVKIAWRKSKQIGRASEFNRRDL